VVVVGLSGARRFDLSSMVLLLWWFTYMFSVNPKNPLFKSGVSSSGGFLVEHVRDTRHDGNHHVSPLTAAVRRKDECDWIKGGPCRWIEK